MRFLTIIRNSSSDSCSSFHQPTIVLVHVGIFQSLCEDGSNVGTSIICLRVDFVFLIDYKVYWFSVGYKNSPWLLISVPNSLYRYFLDSSRNFERLVLGGSDS